LHREHTKQCTPDFEHQPHLSRVDDMRWLDDGQGIPFEIAPGSRTCSFLQRLNRFGFLASFYSCTRVQRFESIWFFGLVLQLHASTTV
jgi:hypothetical protein